MSRRLHSLDALRGIAALSVVFWHWICFRLPAYVPGLEGKVFHAALRHPAALAQLGGVRLLTYSPLRIFFGGNEAVALFFVLSGFVLSLPLWNGEPFGYGPYLVKRIFRLEVPYLGALALAVAGNVWLSGGGLAGANEWFNQTWRLPVHASDVWAQVLPIGFFDVNFFSSAFWSLVHEMRISLVYPFVILALRRHARATLWMIPVPLMLLGATMEVRFPYGRMWQTVEVLGFFLAGASLARDRERIVQWYARMPMRVKFRFAVLAALLYTFGWSWKFPAYLLGLPIKYRNLFICAGITGIVVLALVPGRFHRLLAIRPARWLGKVSYSLYLTHLTVLFALVYTSRGTHVLFWIYLVLALVTASVYWKLVEGPALRTGRALAAAAT